MSLNPDLIIYDFDGVMTDNKVLVFEDGREAVTCNRSDGLAVAMIKKAGIPQIIISTEKNDVVRQRARKLNIDVMNNISDKRSTVMQYCEDQKIDLKNVVYIGNDVNDLEAMLLVGHPMAPQDANQKIKDIAKTIINKNGGDGVIKEFFEQILKP